jgi:biopolymer transport protein TolQ
MRRLSREFSELFKERNGPPLNFQCTRSSQRVIDPFFEVYKVAKQNTLQLINRNHSHDASSDITLSLSDLDLVGRETATVASLQGKSLDKHLFILSTIVTLGPFLGLLGTVWGILMTFAELPKGFSTSNVTMLGGLSMALATTVIGLVVAIPALVGYNYLKNANREYKRELEHFTQLLLGSIEMQYRRH